MKADEAKNKSFANETFLPMLDDHDDDFRDDTLRRELNDVLVTYQNVKVQKSPTSYEAKANDHYCFPSPLDYGVLMGQP